MNVYHIVNDCMNYRVEIHPRVVWENVLPMAYLRSLQDLNNTKETIEQEGDDELEPYEEGGMVVPYEVKNHPERGRGVYATEDIPEGKQVWTDTHFHFFESEESFLEFLKCLPPHLQCDAILWTYPEQGGEQVALTFDEGVYINDGGTASPANNIDSDAIAVKPIQAGEELLQDYSEFIGDHEVTWFDELRSKMFGKLNYTQQGSPKQQKLSRQMHQLTNITSEQLSHVGYGEAANTSFTTFLPQSYLCYFVVVGIKLLVIWLLWKVYVPKLSRWRRSKAADTGCHGD